MTLMPLLSLGRRWKARESALVMVAACLLVALYVLAARANAFCVRTDEAVYVLFARSLRSGIWDWPSDPLPGYPLLLILPDALLHSRWGLYWTLGVLPTLAVPGLAWLLARRLLDPTAAFAAAALTALHPLILDYAGTVMPDIPFMALSLALFAAADRAQSRRDWALLGGLGALAALMRPEGSWLVACALAVPFLKGRRKAAAFCAFCSYIPVGLWILRDYWFHHQITGYAVNWKTQVLAQAGGAAAQAHIASQLLGEIFGHAFWALPFHSPALSIAAGGLCLSLAGVGAAVVIKRRGHPLAFAMASYLIGLLCVHLTWTAVTWRYLVHFLPFLWIFIIIALRETVRVPWAPIALGALLAPAFLVSDVLIARKGWRRDKDTVLPRTLAWIKANAPQDAVLQSFVCAPIRLLSGHMCYQPDVVPFRDYWIWGMLLRRVSYAHVVMLVPRGFFTSNMEKILSSQERWARSSPYLKEAYSDDAEHSQIFRLEHPRPLRYTQAMNLYQKASQDLAHPDGRARARLELLRSARLEPALSLPWLTLASLETAPRWRLAFLKKAAKADPTSPEIRKLLATARFSARRSYPEYRKSSLLKTPPKSSRL